MVCLLSKRPFIDSRNAIEHSLLPVRNDLFEADGFDLSVAIAVSVCPPERRAGC
jgi:hypothetical protein